jgi:hypothetical protein
VATAANARNKIYFTVDPKDARELAHHTAATRLVIGAQEPRVHPGHPITPTRRRQATAVRAACNTKDGAQREPSAIEALARSMARRHGQERRQQRPPAHNCAAHGT